MSAACRSPSSPDCDPSQKSYPSDLTNRRKPIVIRAPAIIRKSLVPHAVRRPLVGMRIGLSTTCF
jgi:hypothetical protein